MKEDLFCLHRSLVLFCKKSALQDSMDLDVHFNVQPTVGTVTLLVGVWHVCWDSSLQHVKKVSEAAYCKLITIITKFSCLSSTGLFKSKT